MMNGAGGLNLPAVAIQATKKGQNVLLDMSNANVASVSRVSSLVNFTQGNLGTQDMALLWLDERAPLKPTLPKFDPAKLPTQAMDLVNEITYGATTPPATEFWAVGFGEDCVLGGLPGIQRYGAFFATDGGGKWPTGLAKVYNANQDTYVNFTGLNNSDTGTPFDVCDGDSGGPLLDFTSSKVRAVISSSLDPGNRGQATQLRPYEPWITERLQKFCNPHFAMTIMPSSPFQAANVIGVASATVTTGTIIDCNTSSGGGNCSYGLDSFEQSDPPRLIGTGTLQLTGYDMPGNPNGLCFMGWVAGPSGSSCPCAEYTPGLPYTPSQTCTVSLIASPDPNSNELQTVTDSIWTSYIAFSGNICQPVYQEQFPGMTCTL
jgi:hypothetical protein